MAPARCTQSSGGRPSSVRDRALGPGWTPARRDFILPTPTLPDARASIRLPDTPGLGVKIDWDGLEPLRIEKGTIE